MKKELLIYGAGAIGRGYIPWIFPPDKFKYFYVEIQDNLCNSLNHRHKFNTFRISNRAYQGLEVPVEYCYKLGEERERIDTVDVVLTSCGCRQVFSLVDNLRNANIPIVCFENDIRIPALLASKTGNSKVYFAVPDVITSNTAPEHLRMKDPLALVTETGTCYVDHKMAWLGGNCIFLRKNLLEKQWIAKRFLHNTPHAVTSYLGAILPATYIHECLQSEEVEEIVAGALSETKKLLIKKFNFKKSFVDWYGSKELGRFKNGLLYDPIDRVAREPLRKLALDGRLIGAASLCLEHGIEPSSIVLGIMAALCYYNPNDHDSQKIRSLMESLEPPDLLKTLGLGREDELYELLLSQWEPNLDTLQKLSSSHKTSLWALMET